MSESASSAPAGEILQITPAEHELVKHKRKCPAVTPDVEAAIRAEIDDVVVAVGSLSNSKRMHIPDDSGEILCHYSMTEENHKPVECYPPGYRDFCRVCAARYRIQHGGIAND